MDGERNSVGPRGMSTGSTVIIAVLIALVIQIVVAFGNTAVAPLEIYIKSSFQLNNTEVGLLSSGLYLGAVIMGVPGGWLVDQFGTRRMTPVAGALVGIGLLGSAKAGKFDLLLVALCVVGAGYGIVNPVTSKIVVARTPVTRRGVAMSIKQAGVTAGGALSALFTVPIADVFGWRIALLMVGISVVVVGFLAVVVPQTIHVKRNRVVRRGGTGQQSFLGLIDKWFALLCACGFLLGGFQWAFILFIGLDAHQTLGLSITRAADLLLIGWLCGTVARPLWGFMSDRVFKGKRRFTLALIAVIGSGAALSVSMVGRDDVWQLYVAVIILGSTAIGWNGVYLTMVGEHCGPGLTGITTGFALSITYVGIMVMPPLFGFIVDISHGFGLAWRVFSGITAVAAVLACTVPFERDQSGSVGV